MHFYIMFWRIPGSNPFRTAEIANLVIYIGLLLLPITHIPAFLAHHAHKLLLKALPSRRYVLRIPAACDLAAELSFVFDLIGLRLPRQSIGMWRREHLRRKRSTSIQGLPSAWNTL